LKNQAILTPVRDAHLFDEITLSNYLTANLKGFKAPLKVEQIEKGQKIWIDGFGDVGAAFQPR